MAKATVAPGTRKTHASPGKRRSASLGGRSRGCPGTSFPIVAVGASAGGLAAFTALLKALPPKSGMALVLIQHLEPHHESALTMLLSKATKMPVIEVSDGIDVQPSHVYVIPPNKNMTIRGATLQLAPRSDTPGPPLPIDSFSVALAEEQGSAAIGVVLSGTGSDGTNGLKAIKAAGGVTFAQDPKAAQWPDMPMNAIKAGAVDFVLSPGRIAAELSRIARHLHLGETQDITEGSDLSKVCLSIRDSSGVDFRLYKQATVRRRIARRMALQKISSLKKYAQVLKQNPEEAQALAEDIFIHVTGFFRDPECFEALKKTVLPKLCGKRVAADDPIRIWVAGCSSGEEVYSIAMLLLEGLGERASRTRIQVFGSDIQENSVQRARSGIYTAAAVQGVSPARLKRFFVEADHGYQIQKSVRDLCVFARHDLASDPPFSRMDLISCRNVLIYMGPALQKRILSTFEYALKPGGFLFLGKSESTGDYSTAFTAEDQKHRIFSRKLPAASSHEFHTSAGSLWEPGAAATKTAAPNASVDFRKAAEDVLLEHYAPPALIVDPDLHIVHFQGNTSPYLAPATGQPSFHVLKMVRPEFVVDLRTAIDKARRDGTAVSKDRVPFEHEGRPAAVRIEVRPVQRRNGRKSDLLVVFQSVAPEDVRGESKAPAGKKGAAQATRKLEKELTSTREHLRTLIAEHDTAQEEMKAANEEILSSNEELQSTNEELETAKEELQSTNEELITLNEELQQRNAELNILMQDLNNLLVGIDIPVLVLDAELCVRRFTPVAGALLNLIPGDVGRPFSNIASSLNVADWNELFSEVTGQGRLVEREVSDRNGQRYSLRMRPYKTADNKIEGVLVVVLNLESIYQARDEARESGDYARAVVNTVNDALVIVNSEYIVLSVNNSFSRQFGASPQEMARQPFFGSGPAQFNAAQLRDLLHDVLAKDRVVENFEFDQSFAGIGRRRLVLNASRIAKSQTVLVAIKDITETRRAEEELQRSESTIRSLLESAPQSVIAVSPDGEIVLAKGNTEKVFGYKQEELIGQPLANLIPESLRARHAEHHRGFFVEMQNRPMGSGRVLEARRKDGSVFPVEIGLSAIETASGKLGVAFVTDITERLAQERIQQANALAAKLYTAQEEERRRISRELHDEICQQLAALAIDIGGLSASPPSPEDSPKRFKELQSRIVKASEQARHIAYELHPSVLDDLGLTASTRALCKEFSDQNPDIAMEFNDGAVPASLPLDVASCVFRVAQACLQNVATHSKASHVSVTLAFKEDAVVLTIADDGVGFDRDAIKGLGLIGAEERARLLNGTFTVASQQGHGTRCALEIPSPGKGA